MINQLTPMLRVPDVQSSIDWYKNLGVEVLAINQPEGCPVDWAQLRYGEAVFMITAGGMKHGGSSVTLYFYTDDVEALHQAFKHKGIAAELETAFHGMREINIQDPDGFGLVFGQRVAEQPASIRKTDTDDLTGLLSKGVFDATLTRFIAEEKRTVSVAFLDVDRFAEVNMKTGREAGDEVLKQLAQVFTELFSDSDSQIFRIGGDEFSILMPGTEKEQAFLDLERARNAFESLDTLQEIDPLPTISIGIATYPDDGMTLQEVARKTDDALFRAKNAGRNRVGLARDEKKVPKTSHYTQGQLDRLSALSDKEGVGEAELIREALDGLLKKYSS